MGNVVYLQEYNLEVLGAIAAGDIDQHVAVPRRVDDGMIVFLIRQQCDGGTDFDRAAESKSNCDQRGDDVSRSYSR